MYILCTNSHHPSQEILSQTLMYSLTPTQHHCIPELLNKGLSGHAIANTNGIGVDYISNFHSKHYSSLTKSLGG